MSATTFFGGKEKGRFSTIRRSELVEEFEKTIEDQGTLRQVSGRGEK